MLTVHTKGIIRHIFPKKFVGNYIKGAFLFQEESHYDASKDDHLCPGFTYKIHVSKNQLAAFAGFAVGDEAMVSVCVNLIKSCLNDSNYALYLKLRSIQRPKY